MDILQRWIGLTLALTLPFSSVQGQQTSCEEETSYSCAYAQSCDTSHWSIYIPIGALIGAAIWFGLADGYENNESNSQDALGSIANSKRIHKSHSSRKHGNSSNRSHHGYGHH